MLPFLEREGAEKAIDLVERLALGGRYKKVVTAIYLHDRGSHKIYYLAQYTKPSLRLPLNLETLQRSWMEQLLGLK